MKILIVTFSFPDKKNNSDGRFILAEAISYVQNGSSVMVLTPHYPEALIDEIIFPGLQVHRFRYFIPESAQQLKIPGQPIYRVGSLLAYLQLPLMITSMLVNILRYARPVDIIHAQWTVTALIALPVKWLLNKPIILTARGSDIRLLPRRLNQWIHKQVNAAIDCAGPQPWNIAYKKNNPARYIKLPLIVAQSLTTDTPIEMSDLVRDAREPLKVVFIGRFDRLKLDYVPLLDLIEAMAIIKSLNTSAHLYYLGDGDDSIKKALHQKISQFNVSDCVTLLGSRLDVIPFVNACHLGIGGIAVNGVSQDFTIHGKPQVLLEIPDNTALPWRDGHNALFAPLNDPKALAERLHWAAGHRSELEAIGKQAKIDFQDLITDPKTGGRLYLEAFRQVIARHQAKQREC